jgi:hypothetical protein
MLSSRGCQDDQNAKREGLELAKVYLKTPLKIQPLHSLGVTGLSPVSGQVRPVAIVDQPQCATSRDSKLAINRQRVLTHVND